MEDNIFLKKKNGGKYNPDIQQKYSNKKDIRDGQKFSLSNEVYKPITEGIPNNISSVQDLKLQKDQPDTNLFNKLKELEKYRNQLVIPKEKPKKKRMITGNSKLLLLSHRGMKRNFKKKAPTNNQKSEDILNNLKDMGLLDEEK